MTDSPRARRELRHVAAALWGSGTWLEANRVVKRLPGRGSVASSGGLKTTSHLSRIIECAKDNLTPFSLH